MHWSVNGLDADVFSNDLSFFHQFGLIFCHPNVPLILRSEFMMCLVVDMYLNTMKLESRMNYFVDTEAQHNSIDNLIK